MKAVSRRSTLTSPRVIRSSSWHETLHGPARVGHGEERAHRGARQWSGAIEGRPVVLGVDGLPLHRRLHGVRSRREGDPRVRACHQRAAADRASSPLPAERGCRKACSRSCRWPRRAPLPAGIRMLASPTSRSFEPHVWRRDGLVRGSGRHRAGRARRDGRLRRARLVEQTIRQKLPKGFQTAESLISTAWSTTSRPRWSSRSSSRSCSTTSRRAGGPVRLHEQAALHHGVRAPARRT